jgi:tRNA threonylcarbamoyladenosine biosynthesis protein TsaB
MNLLAFDTATEACTAALWLDGRVLERFELRSQHSEHLLPMIDALLAEAGLALTRLDAIAFGRGPGSFTGLRIGAGVAQGLAFGAGLPVVPVSTLAALAQGQEADRVLAALDARMQQVYWGRYTRDAAGLMRLQGTEQVLAPSDIEPPRDGDWYGAGSGWDVHAAPLTGRLGPVLAGWHRQQRPHAREVARLGAALLGAGGAVAAELGVPVYLRDEVAGRRRPST